MGGCVIRPAKAARFGTGRRARAVFAPLMTVLGAWRTAPCFQHAAASLIKPSESRKPLAPVSCSVADSVGEFGEPWRATWPSTLTSRPATLWGSAPITERYHVAQTTA